MSDCGLGQRFKFESLTGDPCALKASLFSVRISPINAKSETTSCGLPSGHLCLPPVCRSIAEERGKRLGGKRIFMAIPQNASFLRRIGESQKWGTELAQRTGKLHNHFGDRESSGKATVLSQGEDKSTHCHQDCLFIRQIDIVIRVRDREHLHRGQSALYRTLLLFNQCGQCC